MSFLLHHYVIYKYNILKGRLKKSAFSVNVMLINSLNFFDALKMNINCDPDVNLKAVATGSVKNMVYEDPEKFIDDFNNLIYGKIKNPHSGVFIYRGGLGSDQLIPSIDRPNDKEKILSFGGKFGSQTSPIIDP